MTFQEWTRRWHEANPCKNPMDITFHYTSQQVWDASRMEALKEAVEIARTQDCMTAIECIAAAIEAKMK